MGVATVQGPAEGDEASRYAGRLVKRLHVGEVAGDIQEVVLPEGIGLHENRVNGGGVAYGRLVIEGIQAPEPDVVQPGIAAFHVVGETAGDAAAGAHSRQDALDLDVIAAGEAHLEGILRQEEVFRYEVIAAGNGCIQHQVFGDGRPGSLHVREDMPGPMGIERSIRTKDEGSLEAGRQGVALAVAHIAGQGDVEAGQSSFLAGDGLYLQPHPEIMAEELGAQLAVGPGIELPAAFGRPEGIETGCQVIVCLRGAGQVLHMGRCLHAVHGGILQRQRSRLHVAVLHIGRQDAAAPVHAGVGPHGRAKVPSLAGGAVGREYAVRVQDDVVIVADIGMMVSVKVHMVFTRPDRGVHRRQFRMQAVAGAAAEEELAFLRRAGLGPQLHQIGLELIGALVRGLVHGVIEVQVKVQHRIRHFQQLRGFLDAGCLPGVDIGHLQGGIQVLGKRRGAKQKANGRYKGSFHANSVSSVSVPPGPGRHPGRRSAYSRT